MPNELGQPNEVELAELRADYRAGREQHLARCEQTRLREASLPVCPVCDRHEEPTDCGLCLSCEHRLVVLRREARQQLTF